MAKIKLTIFDMDGLLIDSERGMWIVNEKKTLEELGYKFSMDFAKKLMGSSFPVSRKMMKEQYGDDFPNDLFYEKVFAYNKQMIDENKIKLKKGAKELLEFLNGANIKTCVATSSNSELAIPILKNLNIDKYFDYVITGEQVTKGKPDPDIFLKALKSENKENAIVLEDAHNGARAAIAAGIRLILVPDLALLTDEDLNESYKVCDSLFDVIEVIKENNNERATSI